MYTQEKTKTQKKRTNLSINESVLKEAKSLAINVSFSAEQGITQAIKERKRAKWLEENVTAIQSSNAFFEENGLPLSKFRNF